MNITLALKIIYQEQIQKQTSAFEAIFGVHKFKSFYAYQKNCIDCIIYDEEKRKAVLCINPNLWMKRYQPAADAAEQLYCTVDLYELQPAAATFNCRRTFTNVLLANQFS